MAMWPGLFLTITVYSLNNRGDAIRDLLDPRLRGEAGRYERVAPKPSRAVRPADARCAGDSSGMLPR